LAVVTTSDRPNGSTATRAANGGHASEHVRVTLHDAGPGAGSDVRSVATTR
jgi:hypothetical protein